VKKEMLTAALQCELLPLLRAEIDALTAGYGIGLRYCAVVLMIHTVSNVIIMA